MVLLCINLMRQPDELLICTVQFVLQHWKQAHKRWQHKDGCAVRLWRLQEGMSHVEGTGMQ